MERFFRIKKPDSTPQTAFVFCGKVQYLPIFWHVTVDQNHPIGSAQTFAEHVHDFFHIVLYTKGRSHYSKEGVFHPAEPGTCVLIHPGQRHDFVSRWERAVYSEITFSYDNAQGQHLKISFDELLSLYTGTSLNLNSNLNLSANHTDALRNIFLSLCDHLNSSAALSDYYANRGLMDVFHFLVEHGVREQKEQLVDDRFEQVKRYIEEYYFKSFTIDKLAKMAGVSKGYFSRAFKNSFNMSPLAYQQNIRIEAAKTYLKTTPLRCNEICRRVGFTDVYFFYRIFKKQAGMTPTQFRKK